jgi:hypothetical protein
VNPAGRRTDPASAADAEALPEVVPLSAGFRLGRGGWYVLEEAAGAVFRWVRNDAEILVTDADARTLELELEPGPGMRFGPFVLSVRDERGEELLSTQISSRRRLDIALPEGARVPYALTLHAEGGGVTVAGFTRVLNFRVFQIAPA